MKTIPKLTLLFLVASAGANAAEPFNYTALGYPKNDAGCLATALSLGQSLRQATGVAIQKSVCDRDGDNGYDLRVVYLADAELPVVSTESKIGYAGTYSSRAKCEADLPAQVALFERKTGLKPFTSYCYYDESGLPKTIGTRIDGFGNPIEWPQVFQDYVYAPPSSPRTVENDLRAALERRSLTPTVVAALPSAETVGWYRIVAKYYGKDPVVLRVKRDDFYYDSVRDCEMQLTETNTMLARQGISSLVAFCAWDGMFLRASVNFIAPWDVPWYQAEIADPKYTSLSACLADRARVIEYYRPILQRPVLGAVCARERGFVISPTERRYRAELLSSCDKFGASECDRPVLP